MQQVFSNLKSIRLNTNELKTSTGENSDIIGNNVALNNNLYSRSLIYSNGYYSLQAKIDELIREHDKTQIDENLISNVDLDDTEVIINELSLLHENSIQKGQIFIEL